MNVLLDTCALLALAGQAGKLTRAAVRVMDAAEGAIASPITAWEIAIKAKCGKLSLGITPENWFCQALERYQLIEAPLSIQLPCAAADLPLIHRDPFDRVLIATALERKLTLLTSDRIIPTYPGISTIW